MSEPIVQCRHEFAIVSDKNENAAHATVERVHGVLWLTNVHTHHEHRRKGYATAILRRVVAEFGANDIYLHIWPYTNRPLDAQTLAAFYGRFGFVPATDPGVMVRAATDADHTPDRTMEGQP